MATIAMQLLYRLNEVTVTRWTKPVQEKKYLKKR